MVLRVDTSRGVLRKYKYRRGRGVVKRKGKLAKLSHDLALIKPTKKVFQLITGGYASNIGTRSVSATNSFQIFAPQTGTGFQNRQGPWVHLDRIDIGCEYITSQTLENVRMFIWTMPDDYEVGSDFSTLFITAAGGADAPISCVQPSNLCTQPYRMLYDSGPIAMGTAGGLHSTYCFKKSINMKGMKVKFSSAATGNPDQNGIYVSIVSSQTPGAGPTYITNTAFGVVTQCHFTG